MKEREGGRLYLEKGSIQLFISVILERKLERKGEGKKKKEKRKKERKKGRKVESEKGRGRLEEERRTPPLCRRAAAAVPLPPSPS